MITRPTRLLAAAIVAATASVVVAAGGPSPAFAKPGVVFGSTGGYAWAEVTGLPSGKKDCQLVRRTDVALDGPFGSGFSTDSPDMPLALASTRGSAVTLRARANNPHVPASARLPLPPGRHLVRVTCDLELPASSAETVATATGWVRGR